MANPRYAKPATKPGKSDDLQPIDRGRAIRREASGRPEISRPHVRRLRRIDSCAADGEPVRRQPCGCLALFGRGPPRDRIRRLGRSLASHAEHPAQRSARDIGADVRPAAPAAVLPAHGIRSQLRGRALRGGVRSHDHRAFDLGQRRKDAIGLSVLPRLDAVDRRAWGRCSGAGAAASARRGGFSPRVRPARRR